MLCFICQVTAPLGTAPTSQVATVNSLPHSGYMTLSGLRSVILMNRGPIVRTSAKRGDSDLNTCSAGCQEDQARPLRHVSGPTTHQGLGLVSPVGCIPEASPGLRAWTSKGTEPRSGMQEFWVTLTAEGLRVLSGQLPFQCPVGEGKAHRTEPAEKTAGPAAGQEPPAHCRSHPAPRLERGLALSPRTSTPAMDGSCPPVTQPPCVLRAGAGPCL